MKTIIFLFLFVFSFSQFHAQEINCDKSELSKTIGKIKTEALNNSKAYESLSYLCDVIGPRLMWSQEYTKSALWLAEKMKEWQIEKVYKENINKEGRSWTLNNFYATVTKPFVIPLIASPKAFSPGTNGLITADVVYLNAKSEADLANYKGKLTGKIVLIADAAYPRPYTSPLISRIADSTLSFLSAASIPTEDERIKNKKAEEEGMAQFMLKLKFNSVKVSFCKDEGALLVVDGGGGYFGINRVWGNVAARTPNDIYEYLIQDACNPDVPESIPQITVSLEHYNSMLRAIENGAAVKMEVNIDVTRGKPEEGFSLIGEIKGSDNPEEVVVIGGHLDSYHVGDGAADNAAGVITCVEALRIIKSLGIKPKRTIRAGLWGAEEQGLVGSTAHIEKHFSEKGGEKCVMYFNMDNGAGKFRGIYAQENVKAANKFREWFKIINDDGFQTVCMNKVENTDHVSFDKAGLPGFQFIQDPLEYWRTYHTNIDVVERVPKEDLKQNAFYMAALAWLAANCD